MDRETQIKPYVTLRDGAHVPFRPIAPSDAPALQRFHLGLSDYSVYLRHIHALPRLSDTQARHFTEVDQVQRFAIIAFDPDAPTEIIAVVRYEGSVGSNRAEYAALVTDKWQGRGLGTALTLELIRAAQRHGITCLYALVLPENVRMLRLLRNLGLPERVKYEDGAAEIEIDLTGSVDPQLEHPRHDVQEPSPAGD